MKKKTVYYLGIVFSVLMGILFTVFSVFAIIPPALPTPKTDSFIPKSIGISSMEYISIGGVRQWVTIVGQDITKPVLLYLHGGPGSPETVWFLEYNYKLTKDFVVVLWEQRGAGKSFTKAVTPESMTIEQFILDTHEITGYLKKRFITPKVYLFGHSWGAMLGMLVAQSYPGDYYAFIAAGLPVDLKKSELVSYKWVLSNAIKYGNDNAVTELTRIGAPTNGEYGGGIAAMEIERKWVMEMGGAMKGKSAFPILSKVLLFSGAYTLEDKLRYILGAEFSLKYLWPSIVALNLKNKVKSLRIPFYILQGTHDYQTPYPAAKEFFQQVKAPLKKFITFTNSAHWVLLEESETVYDVLTGTVLKDTLPIKKAKN
ncbi:MAG: alpha/beta hydrolase [Brevinematales bacterium]|nr:alpha/beta hydrolase [Brevinematales bacterium]